MGLPHLGARGSQNERRVMKVVIVPSEASRNLYLLLGFLPLALSGVEKRPHCRNIFPVTTTTVASAPCSP
jgi:hypothetical protein